MNPQDTGCQIGRKRTERLQGDVQSGRPRHDAAALLQQPPRAGRHAPDRRGRGQHPAEGVRQPPPGRRGGGPVRQPHDRLRGRRVDVARQHRQGRRGQGSPGSAVRRERSGGRGVGERPTPKTSRRPAASAGTRRSPGWSSPCSTSTARAIGRTTSGSPRSTTLSTGASKQPASRPSRPGLSSAAWPAPWSRWPAWGMRP